MRGFSAREALLKPGQRPLAAKHLHDVKQTRTRRAAGQRHAHRLCELTHLHSFFLNEPLELFLPRLL